MENVQVRVLVFKEKGFLIARCLENNLAVQGDSLEEVQTRMIATLACQIEEDKNAGRKIFSTRKKAHDLYEKLYQAILNRPVLKSQNVEAELAVSL